MRLSDQTILLLASLGDKVARIAVVDLARGEEIWTRKGYLYSV